MRIGVFGGSFDPVHIGHLVVAESAADDLRLDAVKFVLAHEQPFKVGAHHASVANRTEMLRLALAGNPRFALDLREVERGGVSYTVDTLAALHAAHPDDRLFFMVGADVASDLSTWHSAHRIPRLATIVALSREGATAPTDPLIGRHVTVPTIGVSATGVRRAVGEGRSVRYLVPPGVWQYIAEHKLYRVGV